MAIDKAQYVITSMWNIAEALQNASGVNIGAFAEVIASIKEDMTKNDRGTFTAPIIEIMSTKPIAEGCLEYFLDVMEQQDYLCTIRRRITYSPEFGYDITFSNKFFEDHMPKTYKNFILFLTCMKYIDLNKYLGGRYMEYADRWFNLCNSIIEDRGNGCERCGSLKDVVINHLTYKRYNNEKADDLILLCSECAISTRPEL